MLQLTLPTSSMTADRRAPPPPLPAPALQVVEVVEVAGAASFAELAERHALRSRRDSRVLCVLHLWVQEEPDLNGPAEPARLAQALGDCTRRLSGHIRRTDSLIRWENSHFGVLLPGCAGGNAASVLTRLTECASGVYGQEGRRLRLRVQGELQRCL